MEKKQVLRLSTSHFARHGKSFCRTISLLALLTLCSAVASVAQQSSKTAVPVREADAVCAGCHREMFEKYLATPMANASGLAMEKIKPGTLQHVPSGVTYSVSVDGRDAYLNYRDAHDPAVQGKWKLDYFLGSGHLGLTYLYSVDGYLMESPVAYYAATQSYDMKPGLERLSQMPPGLPMQASCLRCHMSGVQQSDPGTLSHYNGLAFLQTGITCESCHGDALQHVKTGGKAAVVNPAKLDADKRDSICISCHLEGDVWIARKGHSELDYKPGDSITKYLAYFVYQEADATKRGVSEVEQFAESRCKRASGEKMSCTTCHDPHYTPTVTERVAFYRSKCLTCHQASFAATHHPENPDCTSCHMQRTGAENIPHVAWTDHRIRKQPDLLKMESLQGKASELVSVFSPDTTKRDLGMAYYKMFVDGDRSTGSNAYSLLRAEREEIADDTDAQAALGVLSEQNGDFAEAKRIFDKIRATEPENLTAELNLGILAEQAGDQKNAIGYWKPAFERNRNMVELAKSLAAAQCASGDVDGARITLRANLELNPGFRDVSEMLAHLPACGAGKQ